MPLTKYYKGSGQKVMARMKQHYGADKGERVFYATVHAQKQGNTHGSLRSLLHRRKTS